ncbi:MAG: hypothetical protein K6T90_14930 [Leptolyngbyaceae cyanobacterium HOT.MB2.61]|nr:hypothetical protein [Leptolyngbyaceae cyanobacterium HOT.MB2.61]
MYRLNQRAFEILKAEVLKYGNDFAVQVQREIALKRWEKLCNQQGTPLTFEELRETVDDLFPNFSEKVLKAAARANRPVSPAWRLLKFGAIAIVGAAGTIWFLNLPFPMIRYPVARTIPFVLLPSFISMDRNYRQAVTLTEQADQLVNRATSPADLELGAEKVKGAQKSLDALPVWFLGYYPSFYCSWFHCYWQFTLDEFQGARKQVGRMEARLFQETNAQDQLNQADQVIVTAKQQYQQAPDPTRKAAAIAQWQKGLDQMRQIPPETLAGRMVQPKLAAYERDFQQVSGLVIGTTRTGTLMAVAQEYAQKAKELEKGTAHSVAKWREIQKLWEMAIDPLRRVTDADPNYNQAQHLMATYEQHLAIIRVRSNEEQESVQAYQEAQRLKDNLYASIPDNARSLTPSQVGMLQRIVGTLERVKPGTTVYADAQVMLKSAEKRLKSSR